jgi:hypothetical protein
MAFRSADDGSSVYSGFAVVFDTWQNQACWRGL